MGGEGHQTFDVLLVTLYKAKKGQKSAKKWPQVQQAHKSQVLSTFPQVKNFPLKFFFSKNILDPIGQL
jgi:hypothetical protein